MIFLIGPRHSRGAHVSPSATGVARSDEVFFQGGAGWEDSWTPGPKPLRHRHRIGPHRSGLLWTLADSCGLAGLGQHAALLALGERAGPPLGDLELDRRQRLGGVG